MRKARSLADVVIAAFPHRRFEWYWRTDRTMPGRDAYDGASEFERDEFLAALKHWGTLAMGKLPQKSLVNTENKKPLVLAVKAGRLRYPAFQPAAGPNWIILDPYPKEGEQRGKVGNRAIQAAIKAKKDYDARTIAGTYYELPKTGVAANRTDVSNITDSARRGGEKPASGKTHKRPRR